MPKHFNEVIIMAAVAFFLFLIFSVSVVYGKKKTPFNFISIL